MTETVRRAMLATAMGAVIASASAAVQGALSAPSDSRVGFQASGPAGLKIEGSTTDLKVSDDGTNVALDVPLQNLSTGIALRDQHMRDKYLEVTKFPSATLIVARGALKIPAAGAGVELDVPGTLQLHGQSRPVTVHYDAKGDATGCAAHGRFRINMNDFGITVPTYLGVTVKPDVDVTATFHVAGN